jgi:hypothetical protein
MTDDLLAEPLQIQDGMLRVRKGPGLGIESMRQSSSITGPTADRY